MRIQQKIFRIISATILLMFSMNSLAFADFKTALEDYKAGRYVPAYEEFIILARLGNTEAQYNIGLMYNKGLGVKQDYGLALDWYTKAVKKDHPIAMNNIGVFYEKGQGVTQNAEIAARWYLQAANKNNANAQLNMARATYAGAGLKKDLKASLYWLLLAADQNLAEAQYQMARLYFYGDILQKNPQHAFAWYIKAAKNWHVKAQFQLAEMYHQGLGVKQNDREATYWYVETANRGYPSGIHTMAFVHLYGEATPIDKVKALMFFSVSVDIGIKKAQQNRDKLRKELSAEQVAEAELMKREWMARYLG